MNKEEIDKWLDEEYGCSYTRLEELHDFYFEKYCDLKEENQQLKEQQKEFIDYLEKIIVDSKAGSSQQYYYTNVLKMYREIIGSDVK